MTNIFEYSNIFDPNIYSDIRSYQNFDTNIFGYSFVSKNFIQIYSDIRSCHFLDMNIFGYSFVSKSIRMVDHRYCQDCSNGITVDKNHLHSLHSTAAFPTDALYNANIDRFDGVWKVSGSCLVVWVREDIC